VTISPGHFTLVKGQYKYSGTIEGIKYGVTIFAPVEGVYQFAFAAFGPDIAGITNPVTVTLQIGYERGDQRRPGSRNPIDLAVRDETRWEPQRRSCAASSFVCASAQLRDRQNHPEPIGNEDLLGLPHGQAVTKTARRLSYRRQVTLRALRGGVASSLECRKSLGSKRISISDR
jgi:hypothetical protein